jgi:small-conductance mechanosensitive channel/CRP-like cAMP-binding protein
VSTQVWLRAFAYGLGALFAAELAYVLLRRTVRRFGLRLLYHLWALVVAVLAAAVEARAPLDALGWRLALGLAILLTANVVYSLLEATLLERPWSPQRGPILRELARDALRIGMLAVFFLVVAHEVFDQPFEKLLLSSTALLAVIGFALQDVLKNFFAGIALQADRSFDNGDWLMVDGTPSQVIDISWRATHLRTNEGVEIFEPNALFSAVRINNLGDGSYPVGLSFRVGLPYATPPDDAKAALHAAVRGAPGVLDTPAPEIFLESYGDSAVLYRMRVWTRQVGGLTRFQDSVLSRIWYRLQREGISIPFPIRTVQLHDADAGAERVALAGRQRFADTLARVPLFAGLQRDLVERLADGVRSHHYDHREVLVREGDLGDSLFVLDHGRVSVTKASAGPGSSAVEIAQLGAGDFFGEMSLLTGAPRSATVTAEGGCEVLVVEREDLAPLLQGDPELVAMLGKALAERSAEASAKLEDRRAQGHAAETQASLLRRIRDFFKLPDAPRR